MANTEDLNRLTSCSLVLLGHIFLSLGNSRVSFSVCFIFLNADYIKVKPKMGTFVRVL